MSFILEVRPLPRALQYRMVRRTMLGEQVVDEGVLAPALSEEHLPALEEGLAALRQRYPVSVCRLMLPLALCLSSVVELPLRKSDEIRNALLFELERTLPLPAESYHIVHRVVERKRGTSRVLALCIRRETVSAMAGLLKGLQLDVESARCEFVETLAAVPAQTKSKDFIFADLSPDGADLAAVKGGSCRALRHLSDTGRLQDAVEALKRAAEVDAVYVSGTVSEDQKTALAVTGEVVPQRKRGLRFRRFEFPVEGPGARADASFVRFASIAVGISAVLLLAGFLLPLYRDHRALKRLSRQIEEVKAKAAVPIEQRRSLDTDREKLKVIRGIEEKRVLPARVLAELSQVLPGDVWLTGMGIDDKGVVELKGFAGNAAGLVEILEKSDMFRNAEFSAPMVAAGDKAKFAIKMEIEK